MFQFTRPNCASPLCCREEESDQAVKQGGAMFQFTCPNCASPLCCREEESDQAVRCDSCGQTVPFPTRTGTSAQPRPAEAPSDGGTEQMVFQHNIGWLAVLTVPFALLGLGAMILMGYVGLTGNERPRASLAAVGSGLGVFLAGLGLTFWHLRKVIDRRQGRVIDRWWVLGVARTKEYRLEDFHTVGIVHGAVSSPHATYDRYKVYLLGRREQKRLVVYLTEFSWIQQAQAKADEVGKFTGLKVVDVTQGKD
jgi:hypothetical protein